MADIVPELLDLMQQVFREEMEVDPIIKRYTAMINKGTAGFIQADKYAAQVGRVMSNTMCSVFATADLPDGRIYYNIANRIIPQMMEEEFDSVTAATKKIIAQANKKAGISLQAMEPDINRDRIAGIVDAVSSQTDLGAALEYLQSPIENFALHTVDDTVRHNAKIQYGAGLQPKIVRSSNGRCCQWCEELVGEYDYPVQNPEVYQRHENCNCVVEFRPVKMKAQNVWTKDWREE